MKVKMSDLLFALYSKEFINNLMEYLDKNYLPTSDLEVELSTEGYYGNRCLVIRDYCSEGIKVSHKEVDMLDILDYKLWDGKDVEIDVMDYLYSVELEENIEYFKDMDDRYGYYEMED